MNFVQDMFAEYKALRDARGVGQTTDYASSELDRYLASKGSVAPKPAATSPAPAVLSKAQFDTQEGADVPAAASTSPDASSVDGPSVAEQYLARYPQAALGMRVMKAAPAVAGDIGMGAIQAPRAIIGGAIDSANSVIGLVDDIAMGLNDLMPLGGIDGSTSAELKAQRANGDTLIQKGIPNFDRPDSVTGNLIRSATGFLLPFSKIKKGVEAAGISGRFVGNTLAAALTSFVTADQNEGHLSDFWKEAGLPQNVLTDFLASDPTDTSWDKRFKDSVEGLGLGVVGDLLVKGAKLLQIGKSAAPAGPNLAQIAAQEVKPAYTIDQLFLPTPAKGKTAGDAMVIASKSDQALLATGDATPNFLVDAGKIGGDKIKINFARIDTPDDIKATIGRMADAFSSNIDEARRGATMSFDQMKGLADDLGYSVDDLLSRTRGQPMNAETALAARRLMSASATNLTALAERAASATATDADLFNFRRAMGMHAAIQNEVIAARTETARALASWRIGAEAGEVAQADIKAALDSFGGSETASEIAKRIVNLKAMGAATPGNISKIAQAGFGARVSNAVTEAYIASLLSGPKTHIVNFTSGFTVSAASIIERAAASKVPGSAVASGEALAMLGASVSGFRKALSLGWQGLKSGEGGLALGSKMEARDRAISAAAFNAQNTTRGAVIDFVGSAFSIPGRFLVGADEFWKSINMDMEVSALAVRQATTEGLSGPAFVERVTALSKAPTREMLDEAREAALKATFQEDTGKWGKALMSLRTQSGFLGRVILPFVKTPTNLFRYTMERTPMAPLVAQWRNDIAAGGVRATKAATRAALGTTVTMSSIDLAMNGYLTGAGPSDPAEKAALLRQGWKPYSLKIGDKYYEYNRLDPLGMTLGMSATFGEWLNQAPPDDEELAARTSDPMAAFAVAVSQSVLNKTYMQGLAGISEAMANPDRYAESEITQMLSGFMPFGALSGTVERMVDPEVRLAPGIWETVQSKIAGLSEGLPLRRDLWGDPIKADSGLGAVYDNLSPVGVSKAKESPIDQEFGKLGYFPAQIPFGVISFNGVPVDMKEYPEVYSELVRLAGNGQPDMMTGKGARDRLNDLVTGKDPLSAVYDMRTGGPEGGKAQMIRGILNSYREDAQKAILDDPKFAGFRMFWEDQRRIKSERTQKMDLAQ